MSTLGDGADRADWPQQQSQDHQNYTDTSHSHSSLSRPCGDQSQSRLHLPLRTCSPRSLCQTNFQLDHPQRQSINVPCPQLQQSFEPSITTFSPSTLADDLFSDSLTSQLLPQQHPVGFASQILPPDPAGAATTSNINPISTTNQPPLSTETLFSTVIPQYSQQHPRLDGSLGKSSKGKGLEIAPAIGPISTESLGSWPHPPLLPRSTTTDWPLPPAPSPNKPQALPMRRNVASADRRREETAGSSAETGSLQPSKLSRSSPKVSRKRARVDDDVDEGDAAETGDQSPDPTRDAERQGQKKKARGRPRKINSGEVGHTERRRQQIREAQRAYRARKDSAITDLEEKLNKAHEKMSSMASEFSNFIQLASSKGVLTTGDVEVERRLKDISSKLQTMASESASAGIGTGQPQTAGSSSSSEVSNASGGNGHRPLAPVEATASASVQDFSPSFVDLTQSLQPDSSYEIMTHPTLNNASFPNYDPSSQILDNSDEKHHSSVSCYMEGIDPGLQAPVSYAHQELTFGRRLQRNIIERGLRLVSMESPPPFRFAAVFGFCLLYESKEKIAERLAARLDAPEDESLNHWIAPFTNLGGAGWNYPANAPSLSSASSISSFEPAFGNQGTLEANKPQPEYNTGRSMGPWKAAVEETNDHAIGRGMKMIIPGFTGEFLDTGEVEIYLRQRGIHISANADIVTAEVDIDDFNGEVHVFAYNRPRNTGPRLISGPNMVRGPALFTDGSVQGAPDTNTAFPFMCPAIPMTEQWPPPPRRVVFEINVTVFEQELCSNAVCLGRTPAIRPRDIDAALKKASTPLAQEVQSQTMPFSATI